MEAVIQDFDDRVTEVDSYLKVLARLENPNVGLYDRAKRRRLNVLKHGSFKVMKATVFLLIYNLVESAIRSGFRELYERVRNEGKSVDDLRAELRRLWVSQQFRRVERESASLQSYRDVARDIVEDVITRSVVELSSEALPVSGNLDARLIREVCKLHGVSAKTHYRSQGGAELRTVKEQRNALGHGDISFSTCGQQYSVSDLKRIKRQVVVFVRGILQNLQRFVENGEYVA